MALNLTKWRRDWTLMSVFFKGEEIAAINEKIKNLKIENLILCSFENRFARCGGLSAVVTNILPYLKETNNIPSVSLITPFYPEIMGKRKLKSTGIKFSVPYNNRSVQAEIFAYTLKYQKPDKGSLKEYYLKANGYFQSNSRLKDPYVYHEKDPQLNSETLSEHSLFFASAVPYAMKALNIRENIIFHLHEWQTALIALTSKEAMLNGTLESCGSVQTMHNSFDSPISWKLLTGIVNRQRRKKLAEFPGEELSAYQIGLQLVDAPVTTVSENFSKELTTDILQTEHYALHLQNILRRSGVYGIDNGLFIDFSSKFPKKEEHTIEEVRTIKLKNRKALLRTLSRYNPKERFGDLTYKGKSITRLPDEVPIFVMSGRLDPIQKGYGIFLRAIERFDEDEIKVILTPMPVNSYDLDYFYEVACKCKGNLTVFPIRMEKGYSELQTGSTYGVMPSIYEPFGAAVEYMANGTVNIGRGTGGLINQIDSTCGFLYKEEPSMYTLENINDFIETSNIMQMRKLNPLAQNMSINLYNTLRKAVDLYQSNPDKYYKMILNGFKKAKKFNWETSSKKYYQVYEKAINA